jgi:hypothetical protein
MSAVFDPYYKWLGIPPAEQPPNHYRLLGISLFESDQDVIEAAADQRMIHLRSFQSGQHAELSQKLLNEVAVAKLCLLKAHRRAAYDAALRQQLAANAPPRPMSAMPPPLPPVGSHATAVPMVPNFAVQEPAIAVAQHPVRESDAQSNGDVDPLDFSSVGPVTTRPAIVLPKRSVMPIIVMIAAPILGLLVVAAAIKVFNDREEAAERQSEKVRTAATGSAPVGASPLRTLPPMLVVEWPKETRTGGFLILDGVTYDLSQVTGPLEYKLTPGPHKLGLHRPGMAPIDVAVPPQHDGGRYTYRPKWRISEPSGEVAAATDVDHRFTPTPQPQKQPDERPADEPVPRKAPDIKPRPAPQPVDTAPTPLEAARAPVPDADAQQKATAQMKEVLKDEFAQAKTPEAQVALAKHLAKLAEEDFARDPAVSYVMAKEALDMAVKQGEPALASELVGGFSNHFDLDTWDLKATTLGRLARSAKTADTRAALAKGALELVDRAMADERYDVADKLVTTASYLAGQLKDVAIHDAARDASDRVRRFEKATQEGEAAAKALAANPDDPDANLAAGRFKCFLKEDWKFGLPLLLKGSDDALKDIARQEAADPKQAGDQVKLADAWWDLAEKRAGDKTATAKKDEWTIKPMRARAAEWYQRALPNLSGLALTKAQKRIDEALPAAGESSPFVGAFLDDLQEQESSIGVGRLGKHGEAGWLGARIKVRGAQPSHALSMHPPANGASTVSYALDGKWKNFSGTAAITDDGKDVQGTLTFKVSADGKQLWSSRPIRAAGQFQECNVRLSGGQTLKLEVTCTGPNRSAHAVWVNPALTK